MGHWMRAAFLGPDAVPGTPEVTNKVEEPAVPSGPTKLKGPAGLLLAAAWNLTVVLAGTVAVHDIVVQCVDKPAAGFASFAEEI